MVAVAPCLISRCPLKIPISDALRSVCVFIQSTQRRNVIGPGPSRKSGEGGAHRCSGVLQPRTGVEQRDRNAKSPRFHFRTILDALRGTFDSDVAIRTPPRMLPARRLLAASTAPIRRGVASRASPFAPPGTSADAKGLSREEEQRQRVDAMMREKTLREVAAAGAARRPDGVTHVLGDEQEGGAVDEAIAEQFGREYAANYDEDRDEWGGPKGVRHPDTRRARACPAPPRPRRGGSPIPSAAAAHPTCARAPQARSRPATATGSRRGAPPTFSRSSAAPTFRWGPGGHVGVPWTHGVDRVCGRV